MNTVIRTLWPILLLVLSAAAWAQDSLVTLPTREGQSISYWWMPADGARTTVLLFSGGSGGIGLRDGRPQSNNFLIRSGEFFRAQGLNVAMLGNPTDKRQLDDAWRTSAMHRADVNGVLADLRQRGSQVLWLVGTSRGTVSVAALGIALQDQLAGLVLTASIGSHNVAATSVPQQAIDQIRLPVLVYHHKNDACRITLARDTEWILRGLKNAPIKKRWIVEGGSNPEGDPCRALHWHGFIGMEEQAAKDISGWIAHPQSE
jgi:pimeloyl-ACP methyl ester carboxylesterase